ncbi:hypothetical protein JCGZ_08467 [Jatropha curcas]|uniref:Protein EARLY FLOWERING 4 domain-containing protein n=2 Tax=Jatropha curcas TaxID=180498 RepID=A0A067LNP8_JATCU|nr:hypothetical protein JCGZ_08467 [Jatropha curcas]
MDDTTTSSKPKLELNSLSKSNNKKPLPGGSNNCEDGGGDDEDDIEEEECDKEVWNTLCKSFRQVQSVLDQNRDLIHQVNENHQSRIPDNMAKNVPLIREINRNISKVISIYSDLSVNFSNVVQERRRINNGSSVERTDC